MRIFRKIISSILCVVILASFPLVTRASEIENDHRDVSEYITFTTGNERINSDGTFTFNVRSDMRSGTFTANKNTITIYTKCRLFNVNTGSVTKSESSQYTLTLYDKDGNEVGSYTGSANNKKMTQKFSVEKEQDYYFVITCNPKHTMPYSLNGTGKVSNVTV